MNEPKSHPALPHLQITFTPEEYQHILDQARGRSGGFIPGKAGEDYWKHLPNYLIARCPLCDACYTSILDTHSLEGGGDTDLEAWRTVGGHKEGEHYQIGCAHFVAVQKFVNLNGLQPVELSYYSNKLDVPFIMPIFVPDDLPAFAVMHSLPICRIEHGQFVPRYAAYFMTYYAATPDVLWQRRRAEEASKVINDPAEYHGTWLYGYGHAIANPELRDLRLWVTRKKLQWLDPASPDLVLKAGPPEAFPYADIQGYQQPFTFRNGKLKLGY